MWKYMLYKSLKLQDKMMDTHVEDIDECGGLVNNARNFKGKNERE